MANGETVAGAVHWQFFQAGDFDQVVIRTGGDLLSLELLDKKLWAALSCPVHGLEFDSHTLALIDSDKDDRIRVPEIIEAIQFSHSLLKNLDIMVEGGRMLPLDQIDNSHEAGQQVHATVLRILKSLGRESASSISVNDVIEAQAVMAKLPFNGDGIIPPTVAEEYGLRKVITEIIACIGGELDRNGEQGVTAEKLDHFFNEAQARLAWLAVSQSDQAAILPLGDATAQAYMSLQAMRDKIDDYFMRCRMASYDARAALPLSPGDTSYALLATKKLTANDEEIASFPLSTVAAGRALPLCNGLNPAWSAAMDQFRTTVIIPLLGERETLSESEWQQLQDKFAPYATWRSQECGVALATLDMQHLKGVLAGDARQQIADLIQRDLVIKPEFDALGQVEKLVRYVRDLAVLLRNFVSFADFYSGKNRAIFQAGTLYIDQRSCGLCIRVDDVNKHAVMAPLSHTYLIYCECRRRGGSDKMNIVAAITSGDEGGLMVGRNGLFFDRMGQDWDATVVKVIEHSISVRQAFFAPYKRLARFIGEQVNKMAGARDKAVDEKLAAGAQGVAQTAEGAKPPAPFDIAKFAGIFAAIGLALGAIGTAIAAVVTGLLALAWWQIPLAFAGVILVISGPSMLIAWLKLRKRNLAPLLDANGWAVNTRARINIPFGASLTSLAKLPPGSARPIRDPFAEERHHGWLYLLVAIIVLGALAYWLINRL